MFAFFTEPSQPVLADEGVEAAGCLGGLRILHVSFGAARAVGTAAGLVGFAYGSVEREADLVGGAEEGREAEVVVLRGVGEDGGGC